MQGKSLSARTVTQGGHISTEPRINERIRVPEVRLVGPNGEQVGIVAINDALRLAQEADLDLVEVAPMARPPVCKLMDYGKFKYESALKARESRKNQAQTVIKEIKLRPKIDPHDYGTKKGHVERFLKQGDKVKVTIMFRGREQSRPELGFKLLQRLAGDIEELGFVESSPKQDGRNMIMVLGPHKRKTEAMAAAKADRATRSAGRADQPETEAPEASVSLADQVASMAAERAAASAAAPQAPASEPSAEIGSAGTASPETASAETGSAETGSAEAAASPPAPARSATPARSAAPTRSATPAAEAAPRPSAARGAAPRPSAPRPAPDRTGSAGGAAPKPTAPRTTSTGTRPGAAGSGAPKPTAPRGTTAAPRPSAPKPGPSPRSGADKAAAAKESGKADQ
jgi:translation initiation factor IF-3